MANKMTIGLYRTEKDCDFDSAEGLREIKESLRQSVLDMFYIKNKMDISASNHNKEPIPLDISALLIPDWEILQQEESRYKAESYLRKKSIFLELLNDVIEETKALVSTVDRQVGLLDFLEDPKLTEEEKAYMENLKALGSYADIIKTRAIINNYDHAHLQLDSNTKIFNYDHFFLSTFGSNLNNDAFQADIEASREANAFNASYYDEYYVSVHNKVVFTVPNSKFIDCLREYYLVYCREHQDDEQSKMKNSIYSKVFTHAACEIGIAIEHQVLSDEGPKMIFPARMDNTTAFRITKDIVTAVNQSWKPGQERPPGYTELTRIPGIPYGDTIFDYACYRIIMKKSKRLLEHHKIENNIELTLTRSCEIAKRQLLTLSNWENEQEIQSEFEQHVFKYIGENTNMSKESKSDMLDLIFSQYVSTEDKYYVIKQIAITDLPKEQKKQILDVFLEDYDKTLIPQ